ncbi:MAG: ribulose-phosphate 3-epimerase [Sulfolobales archaeon]|nr:ribulose-phosphate 3-epimerase [Sulfolobales archaeon]
MIKISASIAAADPLNLGSEVRRLEEAGVDYIHIDVGDGVFVDDVGFNLHTVRRISEATSIPLQVHLMTYSPEKFIEIYAKHAHEVVVHVESTPHVVRAVRRVKSLGVKAGVAVLPGTAVSSLKYLIPYVDSVLVATNNDSSFYSWVDREFAPEMLDKIREVNALKQELNDGVEIIADGGINLSNVREVVKAGASVITMGSALFSSSNIREVVESIRLIYSDVLRVK